MEESRRSIEAAELLASKGFCGYAAARAYFAMFYVAEAMLLEKDMSFSRHSAVIAAFGQHFAKTGDARKFHIVGEVTLESRNEAGNGIVADLT